MNEVHEKITGFYQRMEEAQSDEERSLIKQDRQRFYEQLSEADQKAARDAARPFLKKFIHTMEEEVDPLIDKLQAMLTRIDEQAVAKSATS